MKGAIPGVETPQYLTFQIADEEYAIGIPRVREIIPCENVTTVPMTPPWIRGVINLRGSSVPVLDLAVKFGLRASAITRTTCIVIVEFQGASVTVGMLADSVRQVIELGPVDIEPTPVLGSNVKVDFLSGMGKIGTQFALILDIDRVVSTDELLGAVNAIKTAADSERHAATREDENARGNPPNTGEIKPKRKAQHPREEETDRGGRSKR